VLKPELKWKRRVVETGEGERERERERERGVIYRR
jgi:hypothetical protein